MDSDAPYLSVVATARNDNHGGNLLRRMQIFVNGLIAQAKKHDLPIELIVVEWNPPVDKPPLAEALERPADLGPATIRIITVGSDVHNRLRFSKALPLYQMLAKNVGIRRARGEFVLATNIDILFSDELMALLAARKLEAGLMYRADRGDAAADVPLEASIDEQLEYCRTHLIRINAREGTYRVDGDGRRVLEDDDIVPPRGGISLAAGWSDLQRGDANYRWPEADAVVEVEPQPQRRVLWIRFAVDPTEVSPIRLSVTANGKAAGSALVSGPGWLGVPVEDGPGSQTLLFRVHRDAESAPRPRLYRVLELTWQAPAGAQLERAEPAAFASDAPSLEVGAGWYDVEGDGVEHFRWASSGAEVFVGPSTRPEWSLRAELEPGPAVGFGATQVRVWDDAGRLVSTAVVQGRTVAMLAFPTAADRRRRYRLEAAYGDPPVQVKGDDRVMRFRLFRAAWTPQGDDDTASAEELRDPFLSRSAERIFELKPIRTGLPPRAAQGVYTNACGDFTLMARSDWFELRGYPEFDLFSMHLDSVLCVAAQHAGIEEEALAPAQRIFHIEHAIGSGFTPEGNAKLNARLAARGIESLDWREVSEWDRQMRRLRSPMIFNSSKWGYASEVFPETGISNSPTTEQ